MSVRLNGSTGYLVLNAGIVTSLPFYIAFYASRNSDTGTTQMWAAQSQASSDKYAYVACLSNGNALCGYGWTGNSDGATKVGPTLNATMRVGLGAFQAAGRQLWYGDTTEGVSTNAGTDQVSSHDTFTIGAILLNGGAASSFASADIAEVHIYTGTPTDSDYTAFAAATSSGNYPENLPNWVDGWRLEDTTDLTSIGGTRTLTLNGGVTNVGSHPFALTLGGGGSSTTPPPFPRFNYAILNH